MGMTLVEVMVSTAVLAMLVMILVTMVNQTTSIWKKTTGKVEQFREAREAFESLTRRLSQATLNTYWDYDDPNRPTKYIRQAELRFISGPGLAGPAVAPEGSPTPSRPTHSTFFFAPLGFVETETPASGTTVAAEKYEGMDCLLNTWGYFLEYNSDKDQKPSFVGSSERKRFRLIEFMQPSQDLQLYKLQNRNLKYAGREWFLNEMGLGAIKPPTHVLAENIIALVLLPKISKDDQQKWSKAYGKKYDDTSLVAPGYLYDSTGTGMNSAVLSDPRLNSINQLPPIVEARMVAIDEASASRMSESDNAQLLEKLETLFKDPRKLQEDLFGDATDPSQSEATDSLTEYLVRKRIQYRVFASDVSLRGAKWSTQQTDVPKP